MRRSTVTAALGALALLAASCGGGGGDGATDVAGEGTTTTARPADGAVTVGVADSELGSILVDGEGSTLYLFTNDEPEVSTCTAACAENWPPLHAPDPPVAGEGVDENLLGSITRDDGTDQVTYAGMPLYYFAADTGPGDMQGQGVGDVWFVVGADGEAITAATPDPGLGDDYGAGPVAEPEGDREPAGSGALETAAPAGGGGSSAPPEQTESPSTTAAPATTTTTTAPATTTTTEPAATAAIRIENFTYSPPALQISTGTIVTATNADSASHTWTADDGSWDSGSLGQGDRYQHTFSEPGTFSFYCAIHPSMKGTVTVS